MQIGVDIKIKRYYPRIVLFSTKDNTYSVITTKNGKLDLDGGLSINKTSTTAGTLKIH